MTEIISPGECIAVCVCCGARVVVPPMAGTGPMLAHDPDRLSGEPCPRRDWSVQDAIRWDDGEIATVRNHPSYTWTDL